MKSSTDNHLLPDDPTRAASHALILRELQRAPRAARGLDTLPNGAPESIRFRS